MARRKNVKRIDPRYFLDEKTDVPLHEAGGAADPPVFSPLSSTKPGERIPVPGSQRPYEQRDVDGNVAALGVALAAADKSFQEVWKHRPGSSKDFEAQKSLVVLKQALVKVHSVFWSLQNRIGEDPQAPRLEEE